MARRIIVVVLSAFVGLVLSLAGEGAFGFESGNMDSHWSRGGFCDCHASEYVFHTLPVGMVLGGVSWGS